jgi:hypothetical protein
VPGRCKSPGPEECFTFALLKNVMTSNCLPWNTEAQISELTIHVVIRVSASLIPAAELLLPLGIEGRGPNGSRAEDAIRLLLLVLLLLTNHPDPSADVVELGTNLLRLRHLEHSEAVPARELGGRGTHSLACEGVEAMEHGRMVLGEPVDWVRVVLGLLLPCLRVPVGGLDSATWILAWVTASSSLRLLCPIVIDILKAIPGPWCALWSNLS